MVLLESNDNIEEINSPRRLILNGEIYVGQTYINSKGIVRKFLIRLSEAFLDRPDGKNDVWKAYHSPESLLENESWKLEHAIPGVHDFVDNFADSTQVESHYEGKGIPYSESDYDSDGTLFINSEDEDTSESGAVVIMDTEAEHVDTVVGHNNFNPVQKETSTFIEDKTFEHPEEVFIIDTEAEHLDTVVAHNNFNPVQNETSTIIGDKTFEHPEEVVIMDTEAEHVDTVVGHNNFNPVKKETSTIVEDKTFEHPEEVVIINTEAEYVDTGVDHNNFNLVQKKTSTIVKGKSLEHPKEVLIKHNIKVNQKCNDNSSHSIDKKSTIRYSLWGAKPGDVKVIALDHFPIIKFNTELQTSSLDVNLRENNDLTQCPYCTFKMNTYKIRKHVLSHLKTCFCTGCRNIIPTIKAPIHLKEKKGVKLQCLKCPYESNNGKVMQTHISQIHFSLLYSQCGICGLLLEKTKELSSFEVLRDHVMNAHKRKKKPLSSWYMVMDVKEGRASHDMFRCLNCPHFVSRSLKDLLHHLSEKHPGKRPYKCNVCKFKHSSKVWMKLHRNMHGCKYKCPFCRHKTSKHFMLKYHIKNKHNKK